MPANQYVLAQLGASKLYVNSMKHMHFANCVALVTQNLRLCSSKAGIVLNLCLNFEQK